MDARSRDRAHPYSSRQNDCRLDVLYPLDQIPLDQPEQVGETALGLAQLQRAGCPVVKTWVLSAEHFRQALSSQIAREPLLAEWPTLLWQSPTDGYQRQRWAQRLRPQILSASLPPALTPALEALLAQGEETIWRLQPSLWLGHDVPTAGLAQLLGEQWCCADTSAVASALKQLWAEMLSARSLAYWQRLPHPPSLIDFAVLLQPVSPTRLSGSLVRRGDTVTVQAVQGLPLALSEAQPARYQGPLRSALTAEWQPGQQEQQYQPIAGEVNAAMTDCLVSLATTEETLAQLPLPPLRSLLATVQQQQQLKAAAHLLDWQVLAAAPETCEITQVLAWPLQPVADTSLTATAAAEPWLRGSGAAPGKVVGKALVITDSHHPPREAPDQIVVAAAIAPDWLPLLKTAAAVISEQGGMTCHAAILARELGLPAVVGVPRATQHLKTGDALCLDGDRGLIERLSSDPGAKTPATPRPAPPPVNTLPPTQTELWLNVSQPEVAAEAAALPVAGVGLLRAEWLLLPCLEQQHPYHWLATGRGEILETRLVERLRPILAAFQPRPVRYRSLDLRAHEMLHLAGGPPAETNPMLGMRGTFSYQRYPALFELELSALRQLQQENYANVQLLLPFVRTVEEFRYCQQRVRAAGLNQAATFELWMMAEVPSVLFLLRDYAAAGVSGVAIGSNDLTQLLLGVDRDQAAFSEIFDERHPAVQAAIAQIIQQSQALQLPTSLCGAAPSRHPDLIASLVNWGIDGISVDLASVETTAVAIAAAEAHLAGRHP